ncbi:MAG: DUF934 domain-containing protein [Proteobacteria bacterium]|nr:DUF934 domain-containing protein [Burkholderiales bacterium]
MHSLINKTSVVVADPWLRWDAGADPARAVPEAGDWLFPPAVWLDARVRGATRTGRNGVWLEPGDDPAALAAEVDRLALIAVHFPSFTDGRGFSTARLLRERHGYRGELRATGPLTRDTLFYLARCGFDTFELREGEDPVEALTELSAFDEVYQAAADRGPLFGRRLQDARIRAESGSSAESAMVERARVPGGAR